MPLNSNHLKKVEEKNIELSLSGALCERNLTAYCITDLKANHHLNHSDHSTKVEKSINDFINELL